MNRFSFLPLLSRLAAGLVVMVLLGCGEPLSLQPKSGGRPYEVLLVGDVDSLLTGELTARVPGLPQDEPWFDVSSVARRHYDAAARLARNLVLVELDAHTFTQTRLRYEKNLHARPQMVVHVQTPSASDLRQSLDKIGPALRDLLARHELNTEIERLAATPNSAASGRVNRRLGCRLSVPPELTASKEGNRFLWFSTPGPTAQQCLCVFELGADVPSDHARLARQVSQTLSRNIPGESPGMAMRLVEPSLSMDVTTENGCRRTVGRGLWEMSGDAMGGPVVFHALADSAKGRTLVALAFVYAPETRKRNLMRQLEAALYTLSAEASEPK